MTPPWMNMGWGQMGSPLLADAGRIRPQVPISGAVARWALQDLAAKLALLLGLVGMSAWGWWLLAQQPGVPADACGA